MKSEKHPSPPLRAVIRGYPARSPLKGRPIHSIPGGSTGARSLASKERAPLLFFHLSANLNGENQLFAAVKDQGQRNGVGQILRLDAGKAEPRQQSILIR